ncbi:hypothetical protein GW17_00044111 [Ensete ventricosum]|nr:hypothetical protein GW17_00044111 [Ensete ventricosum]RZR95008.1 hypothetical protein BHM03_00023819 [Ensete ventricosum]
MMLDGMQGSKANGSSTGGGNEDPESSESVKDARVRKPPRHLSVIRHSVSTARLVFDGHGGVDAACFVRNNILKYIIEDGHFPSSVEKAIKSDCRAVLGKRGRAIELSRDHKPNCNAERLRIEKLGGSVYDGYLNGQLSVARALGDWHMKGSKGSACPLSAEPELQEAILTEEDEFLVIGCDGLWDVMSSQCAVTITRKELMLHNDPEKCSRELVREALKRNTCDNLTVVVVCFTPDPPPPIEIPRTRVRRSISLEGLHVLKGALDG